MGEQTSYPLSWPEGWPRVQFRQSSRFLGANKGNGTYERRKSMEEARTFLAGELARLGASKIVLSTNVELRLDGVPYSNRAAPRDPGAAVYFLLKGKPVSLACDKWNRVEDNVYAVAKHIEALRFQQRWGVGSIEQAFRGYTALPAVGESEASTWWKVLGVAANASSEQVKEAYRILVRKHHPDQGGDPDMFLRVQRAMERFEEAQRLAEKAAMAA